MLMDLDLHNYTRSSKSPDSRRKCRLEKTCQAVRWWHVPLIPGKPRQTDLSSSPALSTELLQDSQGCCTQKPCLEKTKRGGGQRIKKRHVSTEWRKLSTTARTTDRRGEEEEPRRLKLSFQVTVEKTNDLKSNVCSEHFQRNKRKIFSLRVVCFVF